MDELVDVLVSSERRGVVVAAFRGQHDITSCAEVEWLLTGLLEDNEVVVVDVSEAEFIDSSFLHNLVRADRLARKRGRCLRLLVRETDVAHRALEVSLLLERIEHAETRDEALA